MKQIGISSACYYPELTELSLSKICDAGIPYAELFFNALSELQPSFIDGLKQTLAGSATKLAAVHPFMSFTESFFLFSSYERRFFDMIDFYKRFFEITARLGANIFVIHGAKIPGSIEDREYFERFAKLIEMGKEYGVAVCQENVVHHRSESPEFLQSMRNYIGSDFNIVLDIKQARRAGFSPYDFISALAPAIRHVHISDYTDECDCVAPLSGKFDFKELFTKMDAIHYNGAYIIELYRHSYSDEKEITDAYSGLSKILVE